MKCLSRSAGLWLAAGLFLPPAACSQSTDTSGASRRAITQSQAIAADFLNTELALSPETATRLGLERQLGPSAIFNLDNHSQAGFERRRLVRIELLQRLQNRPGLPIDHELAQDLAVAEAALVDLISLEQLGYGRFDYADHRPYAMDAFSGIWIEGPTLLSYQQSVNNIDQATAFITRLQALSEAVQDTRRRLIADRASGIILPRSLAQETHRRLQLLLSDDPSAVDLIEITFEALTLDLDDLEPDQREQMMALVRNETSAKLRPALQSLSDTVSELTEDTTDQSGIWAQPKGQALYIGILKALTGDRMSTERLHERHLADVEQLRASLEAGLVLPEELAEFEEARPQRLAQQLAWYETVMTPPRVKDIGPEDFIAPRTEILRDLAPRTDWALIAETPSFELQEQSLQVFREIWQTQPYLTWRTEGEGELMPYRELIEYPAIEDAWRLYIWERQTPPDYAGPPSLDQAARESIALIQTVLAAADTGLHLDRWNLTEATDYIAENAGLAEPLARQLALRIMARPGYQSAVIAAHHRFEILSERSQAVLGERYSETDFQRTLIQPGPRPLPFIEADIEAWYGARLAN